MSFKHTFIAIMVLGTVCEAGSAAEQDEKQVLIVEDAEKAPRFGKRAVESALEKLPEGYKLKLTLDRFFDQGHSTSTNQFELYVYSLVPVDRNGKKDGEEKFFEARSRGPKESETVSL